MFWKSRFNIEVLKLKIVLLLIINQIRINCVGIKKMFFHGFIKKLFSPNFSQLYIIFLIAINIDRTSFKHFIPQCGAMVSNGI